MSAPAYVGLQAHQIPQFEAAGATVNLIAGEWEGHHGPVKPLQDMFMATVRFEPGGAAWFEGLGGRNVFLYVVSGTIAIAGEMAPQFNLVELNEGERLHMSAMDRATVLIGHAVPIGEPVVAHGPFVMNTRDEIIQAIDDYQAGKFGDAM